MFGFERLQTLASVLEVTLGGEELQYHLEAHVLRRRRCGGPSNMINPSEIRPPGFCDEPPK